MMRQTLLKFEFTHVYPCKIWMEPSQEATSWRIPHRLTFMVLHQRLTELHRSAEIRQDFQTYSERVCTLP